MGNIYYSNVFLPDWKHYSTSCNIKTPGYNKDNNMIV